MAATLESEIRKHTGITIRDIPTDGKYRSFKYSGKEWFALSFGDCGSFGCLVGGEIYGWSGDKAWPIQIHKKLPPVSRQQAHEDQGVIIICDSLIAKGEALSDEQSGQYIEALARLIQFNSQAKK